MNKTFWNRFLDSRSDNRKAKSGPADQNLKWLTLSVIGFVFVVAGAVAQAQQPAKIPRIGYLSGTGNAASPGPYVGALRQGLRDLGYVEGKNIVIVWRDAYGKPDRQRALAFELVRLKVAVIVTGGSTSTRVAKEATATIPIIMTQDPDPIGNGFVASLARPGGNITGLSNLGPELSGKRLELLTEVVPRLTRVAVLGNSTEPGNAQSLRETQLAAGGFGVQLQYLEVQGPEDIETAFSAIKRERANAFIVLRNPVASTNRKHIVDVAAKSRLPAIYANREWVDLGGLMFYGANIPDMWRRAATYVDKILKGAKPADLPVEQPTKFEFIVNLKAAKQIGLTIPPNVLARADKVIR